VRSAAAVDSSGSFGSLCSGRVLVRRVVWIRGLLGRRGHCTQVPAPLLGNILFGCCPCATFRAFDSHVWLYCRPNLAVSDRRVRRN
jgi:hypothetical protein